MKTGFRPLAGFWFLNQEKEEVCTRIQSIVSVPLRGSGS